MSQAEEQMLADRRKPAASKTTSDAAAVSLAHVSDDDDFGRHVLPLMRGKRVLDVGCINHTFLSWASRRRFSSYFRIVEVASRVVGLDCEAQEVALAREHGYDVRHANAETYLSEEKFDVVHAGDLIEHLSNPGLFLSCSHANLEPNGLLILTTPNTFCANTFVQASTRFTNDPPVHPQHTFYFSPTTLNELVRRHGFEPVDVRAIQISYRHLTMTQRALDLLHSGFTRVFPRFKGTLLGVYRRAR